MPQKLYGRVIYQLPYFEPYVYILGVYYWLQIMNLLNKLIKKCTIAASATSWSLRRRLGTSFVVFIVDFQLVLKIDQINHRRDNLFRTLKKHFQKLSYARVRIMYVSRGENIVFRKICERTKWMILNGK